MFFKSSRGWGIVLLAIWLILMGVMGLGIIDMSGFQLNKVLAAVAIVAGILLLLNR
jgi:hypothetical protein